MTFSRIVIWCQRGKKKELWNGAHEDRLHRHGGSRARPWWGGQEGSRTMSVSSTSKTPDSP